jgi:hypothetical protein
MVAPNPRAVVARPNSTIKRPEAEASGRFLSRESGSGGPIRPIAYGIAPRWTTGSASVSELECSVRRIQGEGTVIHVARSVVLKRVRQGS